MQTDGVFITIIIQTKPILDLINYKRTQLFFNLTLMNSRSFPFVILLQISFIDNFSSNKVLKTETSTKFTLHHKLGAIFTPLSSCCWSGVSMILTTSEVSQIISTQIFSQQLP